MVDITPKTRIHNFMRKHDDMIKSGKVSVWIGSMNSEDELLAYVDEGAFGRDFDFVINPNAGRELVAKQHPTPVSELVEGFSYSKAFGQTSVKNAHDLGFNTANCMVVLYAFEYVPTKATNPNSSLAFVGAFDF